MTLDALPPIAGRMPMISPTMVAQASRNGCRTISQLTLRCEKRSSLTSAADCTAWPCGRSSFSRSVMICAKAKMPISTGRNAKPPPMNSEPKVKRGTLPIGSWPTTVISSPIAVEIRPLSSEDSVSPATIAIASTNSEKNSHGPNSSAIAASGPVRNTRNRAPSSPPQTDAQTPSQMARPGSPLRAIGKPSNVVAIDAGVPGIPSRQQAMRPPVDPPT